VAQLRAWGYEVSLQHFTTTHRRITAVSVAGAGLGWTALAAVPLLALPMPAIPAATIVLVLPALVGLVATGIAGGQLPVSAPQIPCANVVAVRGTPTRWVVAHYDSKRQALSLAARVVAAAVAVTGVAVLVALGAARVFGPVSWSVALGGAAISLVGGGLLSRGTLDDGSPGAVDNASGVIAALAAAECARNASDIGVLITDAEEWGMEGARTWAAGTEVSICFVNFDGLDERGPVWITPHGGGDPDVTPGLRRAATAEGFRVSSRALPSAIPVDGQALATAGHRGVTVSRGNWETVRVVHTTRDAPERVTLETAAALGRSAARVLWPGIG
jgi:hypothetical protein